MPRPSKGPRLYIRRKPGRETVYVIRDGEAEISTGCTPEDVGGATQALKQYLTERFRPDTSERSLNRISIAEILMLYLDDLPEDSPSRQTIKYHIKALRAFWNDLMLSDVKGSTCRAYVKQRLVKQSTSRQELKTLAAAIGHWHTESPLSAIPKVWLPKPGQRRERVLDRNEVARMLRACRRLSKEGRKVPNGAVQHTDYNHVVRFVLIGLYTGTRHDRIIRLRWNPSLTAGHPDIERVTLYRRGANEIESSKRSPPVHIARPLQSHLVRWKRADAELGSGVLIHHKGLPLLKMRRAWGTVMAAAKLGPEVTPHVLRHTCASWHLWDGKTTWDVGQIIGADASTVERTYGHHKLDGRVRGFVNPKTRK